jgi:hypothetical protein
MTELLLAPRITLKSNITKELSKRNALSNSGTEVSNNILGNNKALIS